MTTPPDPDRPDERSLAARCLAGDPAAWESLVERYSPAVSAKVAQVCYKHLRRAPTAGEVQDLVQDAYVRLLRNDARALREFKWETGLGWYLQAVAAYSVLDWLRREGKIRRLGPRKDFLEAGDELFAEETGEGLPAEDRERLDRALASLPSRTRLALRMHYWWGLKTSEIARSLGCSLRTAQVVLQEGLEALRREMGE